jgi:hypothetical protein
MAGATGLEPAASGVTGRRSNQLSYAPAAVDRGGESYPCVQGVSSKPPKRCRACREFIGGLMSSPRESTRAVVGDEGFEPPTPSV